MAIAVVMAAALGVMPRAQEPQADARVLREARRGETWITQPTIAESPPLPASGPAGILEITDPTAPTPPGSLVAQSSGLFVISATWSASVDADSGIDYYAFAIGTGTTPATEANVRYWQSNGLRRQVTVNLALTQGSTYYFSVYAVNGAGLSSTVTRSGPLTATPMTYGQAGNQMGYNISSTGYDATGGETSTWSAAKQLEITSFLDKMLPILTDLYGPPSSTYSVTLVRDLRYTSSAIFFPSSDAIHMGDTATYQLLTHEMVHAWRRDRILSGGSLWQYEPTLSGFEEGFAQAVSYQAMTRFAALHPTFGLSQKIYQSGNEWDYDFQNIPELRTRDFWSDTGGTLLFWVRYEMAAAAISKIEAEHPGFHKAFNTEYYSRLNANPSLTSSRALIKQIIQAVAPTIEGRTASQWIDEQQIFDCADHPGKKTWLFTQHYPASEYFVFNRTYVYETFSNGSDWAYPNGSGGWIYYSLNGSSGTATLRTNDGNVVWQNNLLITPVDNPPVFYGYGSDQVNLTTQATNLPWPGGDASKFATGLTSFGLYRLTTQFTLAGTTVTNTYYRVMGAALRNTAGVFGGIVGGSGGNVYLNHRNHPPSQPVPVLNGAFWMTPEWASLQHPTTDSVDTDPGIVDVTYVDTAGNAYTDVRVIGYGSSNGNQVFLFDVADMTATPLAGAAVTTQPTNQTTSVGGNVQFTVSASGTPPPTYQWQVSTNSGSSWANLTNAGSYSGVTTATLRITSASAGLHGYRFRAVATNSVNSVASSEASLTVETLVSITTQPATQTVTAGNPAQFAVAASGTPAPEYQWQVSINNGSSWTNLTDGAPYTGTSTATLQITNATASLNGYRFRAVATNSAGSATSNAATLNVHVAPSITTHPLDQTVIAGNVVQFSVSASGTPGPTYQWEVSTNGGSSWAPLTNVAPYSGALTAELLITSATVGLNGFLYRAAASNSAGSATSAAATLTVSAFTDAVLNAGSSMIRIVHITELRTRINAVRSRFSLGAFAWTDPLLEAGTTPIRVQHLTDLRLALGQAYTAAARAMPIYTDPDLTAGVTVKLLHIAELRAALIAIE